MKTWIGKSFIIIGIIHNIAGIILYKTILSTLISEGILNTINIFNGYDRQSAFWFLVAGMMLIIIGGFIYWFENHDQDIPIFIERTIGIILLSGIIIMPGSGFWLLLLPTIGLFYRRMRLKR